METKESVTLESLAVDLRNLRSDFIAHAEDDTAHQREARETNMGIKRMLDIIADKLNPDSENYINHKLERRLAPIFTTHDGSVFIRNLVLGTGAICGAIAAIGALAFMLIKFVTNLHIP